jgi:RNA polymerase sigma-70 factor, ECF subfamily
VEPRPLEAHPTFGLNRPETEALVRQSMSALSDTQKRVIELACYEGLSMKEIAARTGDSFVNVRHHYYRGLQKLRSFITGEAGNKMTARGGKCA